MSRNSAFVVPLCVAAAFTAAAQDAPKQFTARELFYSAGDEPSPKPAAKPAAKSAQTGVPAATKRPSSTQVASSGAKPAAAIPESSPKPASTVTASRVQTAIATAPDGSPIIRATATAPAPANGPALGLKITVLKRSGNENVEVAPDTVFHAGDRIQFSVQTNGPGYLYIVNQGSSGTWKPIFPSPEVADGDNHVDGWHAYTMPPKSRMVFDEQTGTEKIFIVFSRDPEPEFENLIYSLQGGKAKPAPAKPVSQPEASPKPQKQMLVVANLNIEDSAVDRMRKAYSRDLLIERVDDTTPGDRKEKAVYVVNPTGSSEPRVVADLQLQHR
ncbi:MAG: DUF4384 domain-containing protein [Acidobacteriia bacterium]|nr:DUF4384 domain-containing protein [Terriglobia bacterium]